MEELSGEFEERCENEAIVDDYLRSRRVLKKILDNGNNTVNGPPPKLSRKKVFCENCNDHLPIHDSASDHDDKKREVAVVVEDTNITQGGGSGVWESKFADFFHICREFMSQQLSQGKFGYVVDNLSTKNVVWYQIGLLAVYLNVGVFIVRWYIISNSDSIDMNWYLIYPEFFSIYGKLFLHACLYQCTIWVWRKTNIMYSLLLEFSAPEELKYGGLLLIVKLMADVVGLMLAYLSPIAGGVFFLLHPFLLCFLYPKVIVHIISFPFRKVVVVDVFMADQLCSQGPMLRSIPFIACHYVTRCYRNKNCDSSCEGSPVYVGFSCTFLSLPYLCRIVQCGRKCYDEREKISNLINMGKYVFAMLEALARVAYEKDKTWHRLLAVISFIATFYQLGWDFVQDWGLLQDNPDNRWLRRVRSVFQVHKNYYYVAVVLNLGFRFAWVLPLFFFRNADDGLIMHLVDVVEVIRRGMWNFFRLENLEVIRREII